MIEAKKKITSGKPSNTLLEYMRVQAWLAYLMEKTGAKTFREIDGAVLGERLPGQSITNKKGFLGDNTQIRWSRFGSNEQGPDETHLILVERKPLGAGSKAVYEIGPVEDGINIPLWVTFEQDFNAMWKCIDEYIPEMSDMRKRGVPHSVRLDRVVELFISLDEWEKIDFKNPANHPSTNLIINSWKNGYFTPTFKLLTVAMAIYRLNLKANESMAHVEYLVRGLLAEPFKELLTKIHIYDEFIAAFNQLEIYDLLLRGEFELAEKLVPKALLADK